MSIFHPPTPAGDADGSWPPTKPRRPFPWRRARRAVLATAALLAGGVAGVVFFPPPMDPLRPWLINHVESASGWRLGINRLTLRPGLPITLVGEGVESRSPLGGRSRFSAQEAIFRFSPVDWVMGGRPVDVELTGIHVKVRRESDGRILLGDGALAPDQSPEFQGDPLEQLPFSHFSLSRLTIHLEDHQVTENGSPMETVLEDLALRTTLDEEGGAHVNGRGHIARKGREGGFAASFQGERRPDGGWRLSMKAEGMRLEPFRPYLHGMPPLDGLNFPIDLNVVGGWKASSPPFFRWEMKTGAGALDWPSLFRWPMPVTTLTAKGTLTREPPKEGASAPTWTFDTPQFALTSSHGAANGRLRLSGLGGPAPWVDLEADAGGTQVNDAKYYYPVAIMFPALVDWLDNSLQEGRVVKAKVVIRGPAMEIPFGHHQTSPPSPEGVFRIEGEVEGMSLHYFPGLPPITDMRVNVVFDKLSMSAKVLQGRIAGHGAVEGNATIPDMMADDPMLLVDARSPAHLQTVWHEIIAAPALRWDQPIGLEGAKVEGEGELELKLQLPLLHPADANYQGELALRQTTLGLPFLDSPLTGLQGKLSLEDHQLGLTAQQGRWGEVPFSGKLLVEQYRNPALAQMRIDVKGTVEESSLASRMAPLLGEAGRVSGDLPFTLRITRKKGAPSFGFEWNAQPDGLQLEGRLGWSKAAGSEGTLTAKGAILPAKGSLKLEALEAALGNLRLTAKGEGDPKKGGFSLRLNPLRLGRSDGQMTLSRKGEAWNADLHWKHLDAEQHFFPKRAEGKTRPPPASPETHTVPPEEKPWPTLRLALKADTVEMAHDEKAQDLDLLFHLGGREARLERFRFLQGGEGENVTEAAGRFLWRDHPGHGAYEGELTLETQNLGSLLRSTDRHDGLEEGKALLRLNLEGSSPPGGPLSRHLAGQGRLTAENGVIRRMKLLSTLLGLLSLSELLNLLRGDRPDLEGHGFYYKTLASDFSLDESVWRTNRLELSGPSMKIVISGSVDYPGDQLDLLAGIRPLQTLDKIINSVPLLGKMVSGSRETLLETQFHIHGSPQDPSVTLKPVDSVAPGVLRDILDLPEKWLKEIGGGASSPTGGHSSPGVEMDTGGEAGQERPPGEP
ncbi:MAG: AsmA-like C-terminal domain-containing protein [Magnetococcales bacterium]|nr:AsmA-like C-terminal domain-containing protein [Magnetococcales bacterium]